ncbi:DUF3012 domain-containing protein [Pleionea sp. CnH1-48]|uniref:DUF3012 domain-containing protein n=1 Tax=Pleionea sp. CnH1-48 TaxID=2954494 RepID=UPI002096A9AA|nr:DUF3012 domain-containing protein [Pleionea sp. CnH1-48]MCO7222774.1 DUF3012 domain-containing protein [Pleionea sp. CnH1-48]
MKSIKVISVIASLFLLAACEPEVGSEKWCKKMKEKPKGEWTLNEGKDFAKHCVFK